MRSLVALVLSLPNLLDGCYLVDLHRGASLSCGRAALRDNAEQLFGEPPRSPRGRLTRGSSLHPSPPFFRMFMVLIRLPVIVRRRSPCTAMIAAYSRCTEEKCHVCCSNKGLLREKGRASQSISAPPQPLASVPVLSPEQCGSPQHPARPALSLSGDSSGEWTELGLWEGGGHRSRLKPSAAAAPRHRRGVRGARAALSPSPAWQHCSTFSS